MDTRTYRALVYFKGVGQHGHAQHHAKQGLARAKALISAVSQELLRVCGCFFNQGLVEVLVRGANRGEVVFIHGLRTSCGVGR